MLLDTRALLWLVRGEFRPELSIPAARWFRRALALTGARLATVSVAVAAEASAAPAVYGSGDPGDCFIIATARVRRLQVVTRDGRMLALAASAPDYLEAVEC